MGFRVKGPHTFTVGYKPGYATPDQILPGEELPADTDPVDLLNLAKHNNLTDDNDGKYNTVVDEETGNEVLVKITKDKAGNPVEQRVNLSGVVSGQPSSEEVAKTAETVDKGGNGINVVGA